MAFKRTLKSGKEVWVDQVYFKLPDGGYRKQTIRGRTRAEVVKAKNDLVDQRDHKPRKTGKKNMTIGELATMFDERHVSIKEASTKAFYKTQMRYRLAKYLYHQVASTFHRADIDEWIAELIKEPMIIGGRVVVDAKGKPRRAHSDRNVNAALATLKTMLGKGVEWGILDVNVAAGVPKLKYRKSEIRVYTPAEIEQICDGARRLRLDPGRGRAHADVRQDRLAARDRTMITVMAFTGVRLGELLALRWDDVDDSWLRVERAIDARTGEPKQTKTFQSRSVPILHPVEKALAEWRPIAKPQQADAYIFSAYASEMIPLRQHAWRGRTFRPAATLAGFPKAIPHELRHTFVSLMIANNVTPLRLSKWVGHSDPMTTMRVYAHLFDRLEEDVITRLNSKLFVEAATD